MAKIELEIDDTTGAPKDLPEALKKHVDALVSTGVDAGFKARHKELRTSIEKELTEKRGGGEQSEAERARLKSLEEELERHRIADAERKADYEKAQKIREEAEAKREEERAKAVAEKDKEISRHAGRLRDMARGEIKIAAKTLGARDASLDELAALLGADLDLDADLKPFVKGADGKPATDKDGKPVSIEGHVKAYLDTHPHHKSASGGTGGGARGGASTQHLTTEARDAQAKVDDLTARIAKDPRNDALIGELYEANKALKQAQAGGK